MQRILITGGTGFIGSALARSFAADGYDVIMTGSTAVKQNKTGSITQIQWDGRSVEKILPFVDGAHAIIHLAGEPIFGRWTQQKKDLILRSRVESGSALCAAVRKANKKPKIFVQASASGYYGDTGSDEVSENEIVGKSYLAFVCTHWESSTESLERIGVRRCVIRTTPVLGTVGMLAQRVKPFKWFIGGPLGSGEQWVSAIHIDDVTKAVRFLINTKSCSGAYNLSAPQPCHEREFAAAIGKTLHRPSWISAPISALRLRYGELADEIAASSRVVPKRLLAAGFVFKHKTVAQAVTQVLKE